MPNAAKALVQLEQGQSLVAYAALTDSGDHQVLTCADAVVSGASGKEPVIRPNGIVTGSDLVIPAVSGSNDVVDVAAFTAYSIGVLQSVSASTDESITRPASAVAKVNSITMTSAGAIAVVAGTDGASSTFSETRGAAGGPPEIAADSVELAQVRVTSDTSAAITAAEIFQVVGQHAERYDFPGWQVDNTGRGRKAESAGEQNAHVKMDTVLPLSHASATAKRVYAQYYTPIFASEARADSFTAAERTHSAQSTQYYGGSVAATQESLGQGSFTAYVNDAISEALVAAENDIRTVKFFPDRNKTPFVLTQGKIGIARAWPSGDQISIAVTVTAELPSASFTS